MITSGFIVVSFVVVVVDIVVLIVVVVVDVGLVTLTVVVDGLIELHEGLVVVEVKPKKKIKIHKTHVVFYTIKIKR